MDAQSVHISSLDYRQSQLVESAMYDLVNLLKSNLTPEEKVGLSSEEYYTCKNPDAKKQRCQECQPCSYYAMLNIVTQKNTEALVKCKFSLSLLPVPVLMVPVNRQ